MVSTRQDEQSQSKVKAKEASANGFLFLFFLIILTWTIIVVSIGYLYARYEKKILAAINFDPETISAIVSEEKIINLEQKITQLKEQVDKLEAEKSVQSSYMESLLPATLPVPEDKMKVSDGSEPPEPAVEEYKMAPVVQKGPLEYLSFNKNKINRDVYVNDFSLEQKVFDLASNIERINNLGDLNSLIIAAVNLRDAVRNSQSFDLELELLRKKSKDKDITQQITILEPYSKKGVPSFQDIKRQFYDIIDEILNTSRKSKQQLNFLDKVAVQFSDIISIRKIDNFDSENIIEGKLARIEKHLNNSNLFQAIAEMRTLQGKSAKIAQRWIKNADALYRSQKASEAIFKHLSSLAVQGDEVREEKQEL